MSNSLKSIEIKLARLHKQASVLCGKYGINVFANARYKTVCTQIRNTEQLRDEIINNDKLQSQTSK